MQEKSPEKILYETSDKIDVFLMEDTLKWNSSGDLDVDIKSVVRGLNFRDLEELFGKKSFGLKDPSGSTKASAWVIRKKIGEFFIVSFKKGTEVYCTKETSFLEVYYFLLDLVEKGKKIGDLKEISNSILKNIEDKFGLNLFKLNDKSHVNLIHKTQKGFLTLAACEVLDEVPSWWQSFAPPVIKDREVLISLYNNSLISIDNLKDRNQLMKEDEDFFIELIISSKGKIKSKSLRITNEINDKDKKTFEIEMLQLINDILQENNFVVVDYNN